LPLVTPTLFFVVITTFIGSLQVFDVIYMMIDKKNEALPGVQSVVMLFYRYSFERNMKGYGSAIIVLLFLVILVITFIQLKLQKKLKNRKTPPRGSGSIAIACATLYKTNHYTLSCNNEPRKTTIS